MTINVPSGIGDTIWLVQKLINTGQKFDWVIPGSNPRRGKQVFDLLPQITKSCVYSNDRKLSYPLLAKNNIQKSKFLWRDIKENKIFLSANEWLEKGNRLDWFFPDLPLSREIGWVTNQHTKEVFTDLEKVSDFNNPFIGIYGSSYSTTRAWNFWNEKEWLQLIKSIHQVRKETVFCLIGAEWDLDLNSGMVKELEGIKYLNTVRKPLGYVIELMKFLDYAFYFPSGLPILSETLKGKRDSLMFYPPHLEKMMGSWSDPERLKNKNFTEMQFCGPDEVFNYVKNDYKLFDRL